MTGAKGLPAPSGSPTPWLGQRSAGGHPAPTLGPGAALGPCATLGTLRQPAVPALPCLEASRGHASWQKGLVLPGAAPVDGPAQREFRAPTGPLPTPGPCLPALSTAGCRPCTFPQEPIRGPSLPPRFEAQGERGRLGGSRGQGHVRGCRAKGECELSRLSLLVGS